METVAKAIQRAHVRLATGSDSPRLDAELLLAHTLGATRSQLLASLHDHLTPAQIVEMDALVDRRVGGEPIAYIVGYREFYGHRFAVSPAVLTPRPETELLVEWALGLLVGRSEATVVDVGTGSGAIAVSIALDSPATVRVIATDVSADALVLARGNAETLGATRVEFQLGDILDPINEPADLIIANLPYLRSDQIDGNRDIGSEPRIALDGGEAGLELINRLIDQLPPRLSAVGAVAIEFDPSQAGMVAARLQMTVPDARVSIHPDLAGLDRFVTAVRLSSR